MKKLLSLFLLTLSISVYQSVNTQPTTTQSPAQLLAAHKNLISHLNTILATDNVAELKTFIAGNPSFAWDQSTQGLPWPQEFGTIPVAAVIHNAYNCLKYLLSQNVGNIKSAIDARSGNGYSPLHYALHPAAPQTPNQKMIKLLKKYKAHDLAPQRHSSSSKKS